MAATMSVLNSGRTLYHKVTLLSYNIGLPCLKTLQLQCGCRALSGTRVLRADDPSSQVGHAGARKAEKISMAMKAYMERAQAHEAFMDKEISEYEIGKRHLANIMGMDPETFGQEDVDRAVEYLMPSSLFDKKARPLMKHPSEVIPQKKTAQFGMDGRPFNTLFYTGFPNYYQSMQDFAVKFEELKVIQGDMENKGMDALQKMHLGGSVWIEKHVLEKKIGEYISDKQYGQFLGLLERLAEHPWAHRHKDLIMAYRKQLTTQTTLQERLEPLIGESGRPYQVGEGERKSAKATVTVWDHGTGELSINGKDLLGYFPSLVDREQLMFPLQFTHKLMEVDIEAKVEGGGLSGQAGAVRLALSRALQSLVDKDVVEKMRLAGLLTKDPRRRERKKFGQERARKKFTWKKR